MKKTVITAAAISFLLATSATAGVLQTKSVLGFDSDMDPIYGDVNGSVKTLKVVGFDSDIDPIYGDVDGSVKTLRVIGFDDSNDPIYE